jgi:hypothetical protein
LPEASSVRIAFRCVKRFKETRTGKNSAQGNRLIEMTDGNFFRPFVCGRNLYLKSLGEKCDNLGF